MKVLWLSDQDVASLLTMDKTLSLVKTAFEALGRGEAQMPPKIYLDFKEFDGDLRAMPAYLPSHSSAGSTPFASVKVVNSHPHNPERGLPAVTGVLVLVDPQIGFPLAVMAAGTLTDYRTGAAGGVAAKALARPDSTTVGLVGCGRQAATQWKALQYLFSIREVRVAGRSEKEAAAFCEQRAHGQKVSFLPCRTAQEACQSDIVVTTTPSRSPVVKASWIRPGTHINAIGADAPGKQELESDLVLKARVYVDRGEQAFHSGEVNVPLSQGTLRQEQVAGELGEVIAGKKGGRLTKEEITLFDSTGLAIQDVAVAGWVYQRALEKKVGTMLTL